MKIDLWNVYEHMLRSRLFEEAVAQLWHAGHILEKETLPNTNRILEAARKLIKQ